MEHSAPCQSSYLSDLTPFQVSIPVSFPFRSQPILGGMLTILQHGTIFEICDYVVSLIAILVIDLIASWSLSKESGRDQMMNIRDLSAQAYLAVFSTTAAGRINKNLSNASSFPRTKPFDSAKIADRIFIIVLDYLPNFFHHSFTMDSLGLSWNLRLFPAILRCGAIIVGHNFPWRRVQAF